MKLYLEVAKEEKRAAYSEDQSPQEIKLALEHDDAALLLYVQAGSNNLTDRAKTYLLHHLISPGFFQACVQISN